MSTRDTPYIRKHFRFWVVRHGEYIDGKKHQIPRTRARWSGPYLTWSIAQWHLDRPSEDQDIIRKPKEWRPKPPQRWSTLGGKPRKK